MSDIPSPPPPGMGQLQFEGVGHIILDGIGPLFIASHVRLRLFGVLDCVIGGHVWSANCGDDEDSPPPIIPNHELPGTPPAA